MTPLELPEELKAYAKRADPAEILQLLRESIGDKATPIIIESLDGIEKILAESAKGGSHA
ncbi:MAG TPA: hypothetical protein HPP81_00805 [Deltaproteobacteria bacterium]|jgi:hypothetical protein|nr:hypothetical protein [Deltaproteobacteria bacterium]